MRVLGIAVVTNQGADASRLRMLWRSLIAWSPILLTPVLIVFAAPLVLKEGDAGMIKALGFGALAILSLALGIIAIATRGRGLHDRLARTWLVPR